MCVCVCAHSYTHVQWGMVSRVSESGYKIYKSFLCRTLIIFGTLKSFPNKNVKPIFF